MPIVPSFLGFFVCNVLFLLIGPSAQNGYMSLRECGILLK